MRNLRAKLLFGFGGLMLLLVVVSAMSIGVISWYSQAIDRVLHENYDSVVYGQKMLDALEQLTADAQTVAFAGRVRDQAFEDHQRAARKLFQDNLEDEHHNITLPGEGEAEADLRRQWTAYQSQLDDVLAPDCHGRPAAFPL